MPSCDRCDQPIRLVQLDDEHAVEVDPTPSHHHGLIAAKPQGATLIGYRLARGSAPRPGFLRYRAHRSTCSI